MKDSIELFAKLDRVPGTKNYRVGVGDPDVWQQLGYFMEVVGVLANTSVGNNPKGIESAEEMAEYVSEYVAKVIMGASK